MDIKAFIKPSGRIEKIKVGKSITGSFMPFNLPPKLKYDNEFVKLLSEADRNLGKLAGIGQLLPNPHILIIPYITQEAVQSSQIEGTQASLSDLFLNQITGKEPKEFLRIREVRNYVNTMERAISKSRRGQNITIDFIRKLHRSLLYKVRGSGRNPDHFRHMQNYIGGTSIENAIFVPPLTDSVFELMQDLIKFIKNPPEDIPPLVQCAIIHYQFETIHPFLDGNGRIGRLLITLFLCEKKILPQPLLYLSAYLKKNQREYYDKLMAVREKSDWMSWIKFFLKAVTVQSQDSARNVEKIIDLKNEYYNRLRRMGASKNAYRIVDYLFKNTYITTTNASQYLDVSFLTAKRTIETLKKASILTDYQKGKKRNKIFVAAALLRTLNSNI